MLVTQRSSPKCDQAECFSKKVKLKIKLNQKYAIPSFVNNNQCSCFMQTEVGVASPTRVKKLDKIFVQPSQIIPSCQCECNFIVVLSYKLTSRDWVGRIFCSNLLTRQAMIFRIFQIDCNNKIYLFYLVVCTVVVFVTVVLRPLTHKIKFMRELCFKKSNY